MRPRRALVVSAFLLLLEACDNKSPSGSGAESGAAAPAASGAAGAPSAKVALLLSTLQEERYQKDKKYFEDKARALGLAPFTLAADNDNAKQLAQVEDALTRGAVVLVIQPTDSVAAASYVEKAHAKGATVVAYDRSIRSDKLDVYVSHDAFKVGVLEAEAAVKATGGKGNYLILDGQSGHSVVSEIDRGYMSVLQPLIEKGDIKIVMQKNHDSWSPEQALKTTEDALAKTKGDIQAILANNSGMARGAVQAVQAAKLGNKGIYIAGSDADAANVNWLCEGKQTVEVLKEIRPLAETAATVAQQLAAKRPVEGAKGTPPTIAIPVQLVTKETVKPLLIDTGFHPAQAVASCK